ncbi:MAG: TonB-dependent receptor [Acidobacteriota bacterium]
MNKRIVSLVLGCMLVLTGVAAAQDSGRIEGTVTRADGSAVGGVTVVLEGAGDATVTDNSGNYSFDGVAPGTYTVSYTLGDNAALQEGVEVTAGATATVAQQVDWDVTFVETITVFSASRRAERIVEAPAAVTYITAEEVEREASHGQLPKLLEFTPGAEVTQSGLYDYNFNTRGFNSSLNRRVAVLIDGRNPSVPFLGSQEWPAMTFPLDDLAGVEFVHGPSAALYGANASSGVLNLTTKRPKDSQGGKLRIAAGEVSTTNADARYATALGGEWYLKLQGGIRDSGDFTRSRNGQAEYAIPCGGGITTDCLPQEAVPLNPEDSVDISFGSVRLDKYIGDSDLLTFDVGLASSEGVTAQTGIGRVQQLDIERTYGRVNYSAQRWNLLGSYNKRDAPEQTALSSGANLVLDTNNYQLEFQTNWNFADDRARIVAGASYSEEEIDTFDPRTGRQTLVFQPVDSDKSAVFGQLDYDINDSWKFVIAGRFDDSSLHDSQFSPKASLVYGINSNNTLRFTYNEAFQVANYSEFFLQAPVAPPADLSLINLGVCGRVGLDCGLGVTPVIAVGNEDLELEETQTFEVGYSGIVGGKAYVTLDYYNSQNENFITDLIPQLGTPLGRVNSNFGPWQAPAGIPDALATVIRGLVPTLTNNLDGSNIIAAVSYTNFGEVDTQGIDFGLNNYFSNGWSYNLNYSWFDFDIKNAGSGFDNILLPNTPEHKGGISFGYAKDAFDLDLGFRFVDEFRWAVGPFQGDVDSYYTIDVGGNYAITDNWKVGVNISNVTDNQHWQSFGGDLLGRRALGNISFTW